MGDGRLDWILEFFSNLGDSMILWFCDPKYSLEIGKFGEKVMGSWRETCLKIKAVAIGAAIDGHV